MGDFYREYEENAKADYAAAAVAFTDAIKDKDISSEWRVLDSAGYGDLTRLSLYADLIVVGQKGPGVRRRDAARVCPETLALFSGRPVLVVPRSGIQTYARQYRLAVLERQPRMGPGRDRRRCRC